MTRSKRKISDHGQQSSGITDFDVAPNESKHVAAKRTRKRDKRMKRFDADVDQEASDGEQMGVEVEAEEDDTDRGTVSGSSEEDDEAQQDGSTAFGRAFKKIMKKKLPSSSLTTTMGPVLSAHKQLIAMKLEEAATERKAKSESKKEKQAFREKGHTIPVLYLDTKDRELIKLATRGVVKLFNAVSRAQSIQKGANFKDSEAKEVAKQTKSSFLAALQGGNDSASQGLSLQHSGRMSASNKDGTNGHQPGWSALHDTFMLGKSRLKDWDTKEDAEADWRGPESSDEGSLSE